MPKSRLDAVRVIRIPSVLDARSQQDHAIRIPGGRVPDDVHAVARGPGPLLDDVRAVEEAVLARVYAVPVRVRGAALLHAIGMAQHPARRVLIFRRALARIAADDDILRRRPRPPRVVCGPHADRTVADDDVLALATRKELEDATLGDGCRQRDHPAAIEHHPLLERLHPANAHLVYDVMQFRGLNTVAAGIEIGRGGVPLVAAELRNTPGIRSAVVVKLEGGIASGGHVGVGEVEAECPSPRAHTDEPRPSPQEDALIATGAGRDPVILLVSARPARGREVRNGARRDVRELVRHPFADRRVAPRIRGAANADQVLDGHSTDAPDLGVRPRGARRIDTEAAAWEGLARGIEHGVGVAGLRAVGATHGLALVGIGPLAQITQTHIAREAVAAVLVHAARLWLGCIEEAELVASVARSEERRVGKECRCRWSPYGEKMKLCR